MLLSIVGAVLCCVLVTIVPVMIMDLDDETMSLFLVVVIKGWVIVLLLYDFYSVKKSFGNFLVCLFMVAHLRVMQRNNEMTIAELNRIL